MCIIHCKTYIYPDGKREYYEKSRTYCPDAVGSFVCRNVEREESQPIRIVETRPAANRTSSDGVIVTEGRHGKRTVYYERSKRSSNSSYARRSNTVTDPSPISTPSTTASSPSIVEVKPRAPSPPEMSPLLERTRMPYSTSPTSRRPINERGNAVYDRPPSLGMPRARENEHPSSARPARKTSISSIKAEVDDSDMKIPPRPQRRASVAFQDEPEMISSSSQASPRLSNLPKIGSQRKTSIRTPSWAKDKKGESGRNERYHDERARASSYRDTSRDRHLRQTAAALEGRRTDERDASGDEEVKHMAVEREAAEARRRAAAESARQQPSDRLRRDADAKRKEEAARVSPTTTTTTTTTRLLPLRRATNSGASTSTTTSPSSPFSARTYTHTRPTPVIHHYPSARRESGTIRERGDQVLAREQLREQARVAAERSAHPFQQMRAEDLRGVDSDSDELYE